MRRLRFTLALVLASVALPGALAHAADPKVEQAKTFFEAGRKAYDAGDYQTAIRALEKSYELAAKASIAFSLAQAYRKQWVVDQDAPKLKRAVELYRKYLDEVKTGGRREDAVKYLGELQPVLSRLEAAGAPIELPVPPPAKTQLMVLSQTSGALASIDGAAPGRVPYTVEVQPGTRRIHVESPGYFAEEVDGAAIDGQLVVVKVDLRPQPARLTVRAESGADVLLDGQVVGSAPMKRPHETPAGKYFLAVTKRGHHAFTQELSLARGQAMEVSARLSTTSQRRASYWVLAGSGALLVGAGVTTFLALGKQGDAEDLLEKRDTVGLTPKERRDYETARTRRDDLVVTSTVLYGAAGAAAVTGILLYFLDTPRVEARTQVAPALGPGSLGATLSRRF